MVTRHATPETLEERLVYWAIVSTWGLWLLGALYVVGPVIGYGLILLFVARFLGLRQDEPRRPLWIPIGVALWLVGMAVMLLALVIGHLDFELGIGQLIKSSIGWAKGWALLAIFPIAGAVLSIRPQIIYRATAVLALQTLMLVPVFWVAGLAGLPMELYSSPLQALGGPGKEFFDVTLYAIDNVDGSLRWRFFAPWATAAAFAASIGFLFALYEKAHFWKIVGILSAIIVCWMTGSRSSIVALPVVIGSVLVMSNLHRPGMWLALAFGATAAILMTDLILMTIEDFQNAFSAARAASSRVRATLNHIGYYRWYTEAYWFGHGVVERGPHLVEFMPIGSHHTWYGLLYVKGLAGFLALAVPLAWTVFELSVKAQCDRVARAALCTTLALAMFSFADNLEIVTYLIWPGLLLIGIGLRRRFCNPYAPRLGASARWTAAEQAAVHAPRPGLA
ncbi:MAG: O-antigen ligase domain-containing protein [Alphaproteobacteria bacterium]|nr:O-antigen ligase domain-containing protein [Alphaproteobacteria bacterium]